MSEKKYSVKELRKIFYQFSEAPDETDLFLVWLKKETKYIEDRIGV